MNKKFKFIIIVFFIVIISITTVKYLNIGKNEKLSNDEYSGDIEEIVESPIKVYKATLVATGDALIHSPIYKAAYNESENLYDFSHMLTYIKDEIKDYDIKYYNQEVIFDDERKYSSYPTFNVPSAWGKDMIENVGFNLVSLATNHSLDCGNSSAKKSALWWESQENVLASGMASSEEKRNEHKIAEANGITYTMLSYTYGTNGIPVTEDYIVNVFDKEKVLEDIKSVRNEVDILIVAMHWGNEYNTGITDTQKEQAKFLGENGVDIILGNHSHCVEPWEWIDEDTIVFYSFGNFISNQMVAQEAWVRKVGPIGLLGTLDITKTVDTETQTSKIEINNIGAEFLYTYRYYNDKKEKYDYLIIPFSKLENKYLNNYREIYNEFSGILKKFNENIKINSLSGEN